MISCNTSIDFSYIKKQNWKYGNGVGCIGDWLSFQGSLYKISNDTIFEKDAPVAVVISLDKREYGRDNALLIEVIKNKSIGTYYEK